MTPVACITGATSGIGRAYALRLARSGFDLIIAGRREEKLQEVAGEIQRENTSRQVQIIIGDLTSPATVAELAERLGKTPHLMILIHNAGYGHRTPFFETDPDELRDMAVLHMEAAVLLVRAAVPAITASLRSDSTEPTGAATSPHDSQPGCPPAVVLVSSLAAFTPMPGPAMYTSTKAYLVELGRALQPELAARGITTQVLCPGFTHTDFHDRLDWSQDRRRSRGLLRWMAADEVVDRSLKRLCRASLRRPPVFIPGVTNRLLRGLVRLVPHRVYLKIASAGSARAQ
ncbi:MAG: SDR family NAD(P)-dependent oxidoreductase [Alkalispirochaeta sp.]